MKTRNTLSAVLAMVGLLTTSVVFGQSCDTLRNYIVPSDNTYSVYPGSVYGLLLGQNIVNDGTDDYQTDVWVEPYNIGTTNSKVRAIRMLPFKIKDISGSASLTIQVYDKNSGKPGSVIGSQVVDYSDLNAEMTWDVIEFDTPVDVTGAFYVGYKVSFATPVDSFALATTQPTSQDYTMLHLTGPSGSALNDTWQKFSDSYEDENSISINSAFAFDVLLSTGTVPVPDFTFDNLEACLSGAFTGLDASNSTGSIDVYEWWLTDTPPTTIYDDQFGSTATLTPTTSSPSSQRVTLWTDGACVSRGIYIPVTVNPDVDATINSTNASCGNSDGTITINNVSGGDGTYLYSIDGGVNTGPTGTFNNLSPNTYEVQVTTDGNGCTYSETITITNANSETISVGGDETICSGSDVTLTATGNGDIEWFDGSISVGTGASITVSPTSDKTYDAVLTDGNGCTDTKSIDVTVNDQADADFSYPNNTICLGGGNVSPSNIVTSGGTFVAQSGLTIDASTGEIDMSSAPEGGFDITYTTTGTCSDSQTQTLTITTAPDATFTYPSTQLCQDGGTILPVFPVGASAGNFTSTSGLSISSGNGEIDLGSSTPDNYTITNNISASGTCPAASETFDITISETPTVDAGQDKTICEGESVTLTANSSAGTVSWDNSVTDGVAFNPASDNTYTVTVDDNGCTATDEVAVTVNQLPTVNAGQDKETCTDSSAISLSGTPAGGTFSGTGITGNNFDPSVAGNGDFTITYTYSDGNGCENSATLNIKVDNCLGLAENELNSITIAPNPSSDYIQVNIGENNSIETVQIISLDGQRVSVGMTKIDNHSTKINVSSVAKGTYFLHISTDKGRVIKKIVVQ